MTDIIQRLAELSDLMMNDRPYNDSDFTDIDEAIDEINRLRKERDEAQAKYERIFKGLEGSCMSCEPVGALNQQMEQQINRLRKERDEMHRDLRKAETECSMLRIECGVITAERDEARREVCQRGSISYPHDMKEVYEIADSRGWDCFKDIDNA
jgi:uncharacterized coiled-coil DUF342 family protein